MISEKLLFACQIGTVGGHLSGLVQSGSALPIAVSTKEEDAPDGLSALWGAYMDVDEFFEALGLNGCIRSGFGVEERPGGLYVYEIDYYAEDVATVTIDGPDDWSHLQGGELRRPTVEELEPLTRGKSPWGGEVL